VKRILLALLVLLSAKSWAAITYGSDMASTTGTNVADSLTQTATLGSTGANSILFVEVIAESDYSTPIAVDYNGVALTSISGKLTYSGSATVYRELFYLNANLTSGQNIHVFSGTPTTLGQTFSKAWFIRYWTYGNVNGLGTTAVGNTNFASSASGSPVSVAFNFTPTSASSTIMQTLVVQASNTCGNTYAAVNGTIRAALSWTTFGVASSSSGLSDYAPGSTSLYSLSQSWNPQLCTETGYGWGVELLDAGGAGPTPYIGSLLMTGCGK
jgi:hypothetical protein